MNLHIIILAAGKGTRMRSSVPKVLHKLAGKPLLEHVIQTAQSLKPKKIHVVYGGHGSLIKERFSQYDINWVEQSQQLGTGHAVMQALPFIDHAARVLVLYGDVPLITTVTLEQLITDISVDSLSLLTAEFPDPTGFGHIVRDDQGAIKAIIEHKDASPLQQQIKEINSGILATTSKVLRDYLPRLSPHNAQGEYYLTDIIAMLYADSMPLSCLLVIDQEEVVGVNDQKQRADLERRYQQKIANDFMSQGLILMDPMRFDVRGDLIVGSDVTIDINVVVEGRVIIGDNTTVGPNSILKDVEVGKNVTIKANCVIEGAIIADNCVVGPFARIRPGTFLDSGAHVGNFVEIKNSQVGKNSKANHLSYLGDAVVGSGVNIGAGTITCNYDGVNKYKTIIEDQVFVGSNTSLVAPVTLGKNAMIGAGSVITVDVLADRLAVARAKQVTIDNWERRCKEE